MSLPLAHVVSYASDLGRPTARAAEMLAIMLACSTISRFFVIGPMADRFGGLGALFAFSTVQATMMLAFAVVDGLVGLYLIAAIFGLGYSGIIPCYRSEEHTSELQSLMRISYAVFCLKKKNTL